MTSVSPGIQEVARYILPIIEKLRMAMGLTEDIESLIQVTEHLLDVHWAYCPSCDCSRDINTPEVPRQTNPSLVLSMATGANSEGLREKISLVSAFDEDLHSQKQDVFQPSPLDLTTQPRDFSSDADADNYSDGNDTIVYDKDYTHDIREEDDNTNIITAPIESGKDSPRRLRARTRKSVIEVTTSDSDSSSTSCEDSCDSETRKISKPKRKEPKKSRCCTVKGCEKGFSCEANFKMHMFSVHGIKPENTKPFSCEKCGKSFIYKFHLNVHMAAQHGGPKRYLCDQCGSDFSQVGLLKAHRLVKHGIGKGKHKCGECSETFSVKTALQRHMFHVHGIRQDIMCELCGKTFQTEANLRDHKETHSEKLIYKCDQCQKSFNRRQYLQRHIKSTHGEKLACRECGDSKLYTPSSLYRHNKQMHSKLPSGPKTFTCEVADCGKVFYRPYKLRQHMKSH